MGYESGKWTLDSIYFRVMCNKLKYILSASDTGYGKVIDIGARNHYYSRWMRYHSFLSLDSDAATGCDIVADASMIPADSNSFDTVLCISVLEHLYEPERAVYEFHRVLKKGGRVIISVPFLHPYHADPQDYHRFTEDTLKKMFSCFRIVKIVPFGNRCHALWQCLAYGRMAYIFGWFNSLVAKINAQDDKFPLGFIVVAMK